MGPPAHFPSSHPLMALIGTKARVPSPAFGPQASPARERGAFLPAQGRPLRGWARGGQENVPPRKRPDLEQERCAGGRVCRIDKGAFPEEKKERSQGASLGLPGWPTRQPPDLCISQRAIQLRKEGLSQPGRDGEQSLSCVAADPPGTHCSRQGPLACSPPEAFLSITFRDGQKEPS